MKTRFQVAQRLFGGMPWLNRFSAKSECSRSTTRRRRRAGPSATASSCRSTRIRRCSRCSAPRTAATARPPSRCRTCADRCRSWSAAVTPRARRAARRRCTLTISQLPTHTHVASGKCEPLPTSRFPTGNLLATVDFGIHDVLYAARQPRRPWRRIRSATPAVSQAHLNMQPFLVVTFGIALQGIFPSQN